MNFIHTENIEFSWGTKQILKSVSIDAEEGKFIGVIGPNGSGKSTFLKCVYRVWKKHCAYELSGDSIAAWRSGTTHYV